MPYRPRPYCSTPGCGSRVTAGRCADCQARAERWRGSSAERGYDARWFTVRNRFLRANPWCGRCGELAVEVDHIDGLGPRGPRGYDPGNLRSLCKPCHSARTARDQPGGWWAETRHGGS
ncbi:HNH endonuclease [Actinomadura graeca]|uniref:HNH endonuclease n=1 Tax=Actinomadura graeca TaxID=2750812 RepID=A0ABX8QLZ3_9ACTN|nr:HNH endonuclease [Actinomadura graeca]